MTAHSPLKTGTLPLPGNTTPPFLHGFLPHIERDVVNKGKTGMDLETRKVGLAGQFR